MSDQAVVVWVDASDEAAKAARFALRLAEKLNAPCQLVTAVPDAWQVVVDEVPMDLANFNDELAASTRAAVGDALHNYVPDDVIASMASAFGRPERVVKEFADKMGAGLVVIGGKHHSALNRWLSGSTALHILRTLDIPLFVVGDGPIKIERILAAVDLSHAAVPTLDMAQRFAEMFDAQLWALHVVNPHPGATGMAFPFETDELEDHAVNRLETEVWPHLEWPRVEKSVRLGASRTVIEKAVEEWNIDLVVLGSHGKGWTDRVLLGSTTEQLLNDLPTSLLVIPTSVG